MVQSQKQPDCRFPESIRRQHEPDGQDPHQPFVETASGGASPATLALLSTASG